MSKCNNSTFDKKSNSMKKLIALVLVSFVLFSCEEQGEFTRDGFNVATISENATLRFNGVFVPTSGTSVTGEAKIYADNGQFKLKLEGFSISEGPDLKIYLSKSASPDDFVNLGNLTSATIYVVPQSVDLSVYNYVLIHCQQYNHLFAVAELMEN